MIVGGRWRFYGGSCAEESKIVRTEKCEILGL